MRIKKTGLLLIGLIVTTHAIAQKNSGYFGKRNFISIEKTIHIGAAGKNISALAGGYPVERIRYERLVSDGLLLGFAIGRNVYTYDFADNNEEGKNLSNKATVNYKGKETKVSSASGTLGMVSDNIQVSIKKINAPYGIGAMGLFWSFNAGIFRNSLTPKDDFKFWEYNFNTYKVDYFTGNNTLKYTSPYIGLELGQALPLLRSRKLLLSYSGSFTIVINTQRETARASEYLTNQSNHYLTNINYLNLNIGIRYAL